MYLWRIPGRQSPAAPIRMANRLYLIDGHALIFKMYYAFVRRPMINSKGMDMSILFGFTKYLLELIDRVQPTHLAVAFDPPGGTFRNEMYPEYKANRTETPQLVIDALQPLTELCTALRIPVLMIPGYEADDVIGTVAKRYGSAETEVVMVTPDKDYGQLVDEHIFQLRPGKSGGDDELLGPAQICAKYGIGSPLQVIEMLTLCGDTSDNVPGVKGVGEVGAAKLIAKYGTVENIYAHLEDLSARQQEMFREARGHIGLSHELVTIRTDVPVETDLRAMEADRRYDPVIAALFEEYEFSSLRRYIAHLDLPPAEKKKAQTLVFTTVDPEALTAAARKAGAAALVTEAEETGLFSPVRRMYVAADSGPDILIAGEGPEAFRDLMEDTSVAKYGYDLKRQSHLLNNHGIGLGGPRFDIELMHYLINPEQSHKADMLARSYLGTELEPAETETAAASLFDAPEETPLPGREREAAVLLRLGGKVRDDMKAQGVDALYENMEAPLAEVLARMERDGIRVDLRQLESFAAQLRRETLEHEERVREMAGEPDLNVSSPKQVGDVLFDKLHLDAKAKKNRKGYTTDEATLLALVDRHPIIGEILEYRAVKKLLNTYIEPFPNYVSPVDGKIHTTFNQALTATGRLSSSGPNLQNIPIRTERGKEIRKAFVPGTPGGFILSADYSQIELRIMAHLSGDAHLIQAFRQGQDVHAATAAKIFGIPVEDVTREQRGIAKTANFGIMYGISSFGLAQRLQLSRNEARRIIDDYFAAFPSIRSYIDRTVAQAREKGYVETLFGRRRYLPDINARNQTVRSLAERNAVNAPIQGASADIIKLAMISVRRRMDAEGLRSRMVLQIHDELVFDALADEVEALTRLVVEEMEHVITLSVPLTVECNHGRNWLEAH